MLLSLFVKVGLLWTLTAIPAYNIRGAAWATDANLAFAGLANLGFLYYTDRLTLPWKNLGRIALSAAVMGVAVVLAEPVLAGVLLNKILWLLAEVVLGAGVYGVMLVLTRELSRADLKRK